MDGRDGIVQVPAAADRELVEELVWTARDFETEVELVAGRLLSHLSPADLVDHAVRVRRLLGMPAARWSDRDYDDAIRGRRLVQDLTILSSR